MDNPSTEYMKLESGPRIPPKLTVIALNKKPRATNCSHHSIFSLRAHTAKVVERLLKRSIERKIEDILG
jgi:hypothetical protein